MQVKKNEKAAEDNFDDDDDDTTVIASDSELDDALNKEEEEMKKEGDDEQNGGGFGNTVDENENDFHARVDREEERKRGSAYARVRANVLRFDRNDEEETQEVSVETRARGVEVGGDGAGKRERLKSR